VGRIAIVSASLGAGHDGAAREIARRLRDSGHPVDCYDYLELLPFGIGMRARAAYRRQLNVAPWSWEWLLSKLGHDRFLTWLTVWLATIASWPMRKALRGADAVVSTYPLASQVIVRLRRRGKLDMPLLTYLTDPSVHPLWIAEGTDLYLAAHPEIAAQVRQFGEKRVAVVAPAVRPEFRPALTDQERRKARANFGLPQEGVLALVSSGSWAVGEIEQTAREVAAIGATSDIVPVVVTGENHALRERLADLDPGLALGWVEDMPSLLRACDMVVLNSGGLTFFEAHATGLPVLTYRCLAGHGRTNAESLESAGLARWVHDSDQLAQALAELSARPKHAADQDEVGSVCPSVAISALARQARDVPEQAPSRMRRVRRLAVWVSAITAILWAMTNGTALAVSHGWRTVGDETSGGSLYLVVDVAPGETLTQQDLQAMAGLHAAAAVSVNTASTNAQTVRQIAAAGLPLINSAGGHPYRTGMIHGRGAIGAGARAIARITSHSPSLMLSDGDVDVVDVGLATVYGERIIVPRTVLQCGVPTTTAPPATTTPSVRTTAPPRATANTTTATTTTASSPLGVALPSNGGVVLVRAVGPSCSLANTLAALSHNAAAHNLHPISLEYQVT
jgi:UDP-N-acetylglucosamine:LPS N-acetylglucosamine transferase